MGNTEKTIATAYKVTLTDNALFNIEEITGYITFINHQPLNTIIVGEAIFETIDRIKANPFALLSSMSDIKDIGYGVFGLPFLLHCLQVGYSLLWNKLENTVKIFLIMA